MAKIKVYSQDRSEFVEVEIESITDVQYKTIQSNLRDLLKKNQAYSAIAKSFVDAVNLCPTANPSDLWQHIIYRTFIDCGKNEQSWKRASGQAFEHAFVNIYNTRLSPYGIRLLVLSLKTSTVALSEMNLTGKVAPSKMDIAIEGNCGTSTPKWKIFGVIHAKTSIAERIKDDAPASRTIMDKGFLSILVTLDSKSFPPPHGNGINYGELGGRTFGNDKPKQQIKRDIFEIDGDFNNGYSYNLRTPPTNNETSSGSKIKTLSFNTTQPDNFVQDVSEHWNSVRYKICKTQPETFVLRDSIS